MKKNNFSYSKDPRGGNFPDFVKAILLIIFFLFTFVFIYKMTGFTGIATLLGICVLFSPMFLTKPACYYIPRRLRSHKKKTSPDASNGGNFPDIVRAILLIAFFIFAFVFIYKMTGFTGIATLLGICALFSLIFLTKPSPIVPRNNEFLDPINKGLLGNPYTKK